MNILLTGGSRGLGASIVRELGAFAENKIYFTYAKSASAAKEIEKTFGNATALHCDFNDRASVDSLIEKIQAFDLDVLINNAMTGNEKEHFHKKEVLKFLKTFEENILPVIKITSAAIHVFRKKKNGRIINILSSAIINKPPIGWSDYAANKSYILSLSKTWATENIRFNITSNCISPGFMVTDFTADTDPRIIEQMIESHPLKKLLTTEEVAKAILFLATCSKQINGINLVMNAGADIA